MQFRMLQENLGEQKRTVFWFGGYGARQILEPENGLHVWEIKAVTESGTVKPKPNRYRLRVTTFPYEGPSGDPQVLLEDYHRLTKEKETSIEVIRTYKMGDKPLIKDHLKGWKTARVEFILKGDFDVME